MSDIIGASVQEWAHFAQGLGLAEHLLPCVPNAPGVQVLEGAQLTGKVGKIPSVFNGQGKAHGIKGWTKRETTAAEVAAWSKDGRYNICIRTGARSGVYAFDCDITDPGVAAKVRREIEQAAPDLKAQSRRTRANSPKFLIPFRMPQGTPCKKRIIQTEHGRIELLADGQQFVAAGMHSSGVPYVWQPSLPSSIAVLMPTHMDAVWAQLVRCFNAGGAITSPQSTSGVQNASPNPEILSSIGDQDWEDLLAALRFLLDKAGDNDLWSAIGYSLLSLQPTRPARQLWLDFSRKAAGYSPGAPEQWWHTHASQVPRSDYRHILGLARARGWRQSSAPDAFPLNPPSGAVSGDADSAAFLPPAPTRPVYRVTADNGPYLMDECAKLLYDELYVHDNELTRVGAASELKDGGDRELDQPVFIRGITPEWLADHLSRKAVWQRWDQRVGAWVSRNCPREVAQAFWRLSSWNLRPLDAIVNAPFLRPDGAVCETPGYDAAARALYRPNAPFEPLPRKPSKADAQRAAEALLVPFHQFPYATPTARSAFMAHILTEVGRLAFPTSPMFWYTAPKAGTGKSLLCDMPSLIATGHLPPRRAWPTAEEELRKQLFASLLSGDRSILFDNVPKGHLIRTVQLCALLTSPTWADRVLGVSRNATLTNRMVIAASGNQVTPSADLARRSLVIRLISPEEDPSRRYFEIEDLPAYVLQHRMELLRYALMVLSAFGHYPRQPREFPPPLRSFEGWSARVRDAILWLGYPDPTETQAEETDSEEENGAPAFTLLGPTFQDRFRAADLAQLAPMNDELNKALLNGGCSAPYDAIKVGYWLRDNRDRVHNGWKLIREKLRDGYQFWRFVRTNSEDLA